MKGIFPAPEDLFFNYTRGAVALLVLAANATRLGISAAKIAAINAAANAYWTAYAKANASMKATRTPNDVKDRVSTRATLTGVLRDVYRDLPESLLTTADRSILNLQERRPSTPAPIPTTRPVLTIDASNRFQHLLFFRDEATPGTTTKPLGVLGAEIYFFIGAAAPADPKQYQLLAFDTNAPYLATFDGVNAGKPVWYIARWRNTRDQVGPWSATVMATILG